MAHSQNSPFRTLIAICALLTLCACDDGRAPAAKAAIAPADLVLRGGKVVSVDPGIGTVEAIAVTGPTIIAVGSNAEIAAYIGPATEIVELDSRLAIPGFIEGHGHYLQLGQSMQMLDLSHAANFAEIVGQVAAAADGAPPGAWIVGSGWHQDKWDRPPERTVDGVPSNGPLNGVAPDNPVLLIHASYHGLLLNDAALAAAGVGADTADPPGGTIVRDRDGRATGMLRESARDLGNAALTKWVARLSDAEREAMMREQAQLAGMAALAHGVTSFQDAGASFADIDFFRKLEAEGQLPVRLYAMVRYETNEAMDQRLADYFMPAQGNDFLAVRAIKRQLDGALGTHGAWLLEPYVDMPSSTGLVLEPITDIEHTAEIAVTHGFQLGVHAIGDRANRETLDLYQRVFERMGTTGRDLRWRVEHAQHIQPVDVPRFGELGVIAAIQGVHCTSDGPWVHTRLGEPRTQLTSYPWRDLIDSGAVLGNGTDVPVESIDPLASYYASVTRMTETGAAFFPDQVMTRMEALASYTLNNAWAAFQDDLKGSLSPGKLADIVVLSQDILTVDPAAIPATRVDYTFVAGQLKYARQRGTNDG